jgi:hypothetical protein
MQMVTQILFGNIKPVFTFLFLILLHSYIIYKEWSYSSCLSRLLPINNWGGLYKKVVKVNYS